VNLMHELLGPGEELYTSNSPAERGESGCLFDEISNLVEPLE